MEDILLTLIGPDKTGIVANLARIAGDHGGNWLDSRMMRLGGSFSGMVRIAIAPDAIEPFSREAESFMREAGYQFSIQPAGAVESEAGVVAELQLSGQDHPGIVRSIFAVFREAGVNVEELSTGLTAAPWSGTPVFEARARLRVPAGVPLDSLKGELEALAADLLVEVELG